MVPRRRSPGVLGQTSLLGAALHQLGVGRRPLVTGSEELPAWMHAQVRDELAAYQANGITPDLLAQAESCYRAEYHDHFVRYRVVAGGLRHLAQVVAFPPYIAERFATMTAVLEALAPTLPDLDCVVYLGDGFDGWARDCAAPVLAFSKRSDVDKSALLVPDPLTLAGSGGLRREVATGSTAHPWDSKQDKAFWRGATTGGPHTLENYERSVRFRLVELSRRNPSLIDAAFTAFHTCSPEVEALAVARGYMGGYVGIAGHFRYRYQVLVDGFTSPWQRYFWGLYGNSVLLKQSSDLRGWFDAGVEPWVHYVPLAADLADLPDVVAWARDNDQNIWEIMSRARQFATDNLSDGQILGYLRLLLTEYAKLLPRPP